jgi:hypothetical protein
VSNRYIIGLYKLRSTLISFLKGIPINTTANINTVAKYVIYFFNIITPVIRYSNPLGKEGDSQSPKDTLPNAFVTVNTFSSYSRRKEDGLRERRVSVPP